MDIDASHVRAHQHAAGIKAQSISKSIGGNSFKLHLAVDANGNQIEFIITEVLCADKVYDSEFIREKIKTTKTKANIPKKCNSKSSNKHMD